MLAIEILEVFLVKDIDLAFSINSSNKEVSEIKLIIEVLFRENDKKANLIEKDEVSEISKHKVNRIMVTSMVEDVCQVPIRARILGIDNTRIYKVGNGEIHIFCYNFIWEIVSLWEVNNLKENFIKNEAR